MLFLFMFMLQFSFSKKLFSLFFSFYQTIELYTAFISMIQMTIPISRICDDDVCRMFFVNIHRAIYIVINKHLLTSLISEIN